MVRCLAVINLNFKHLWYIWITSCKWQAVSDHRDHFYHSFSPTFWGNGTVGHHGTKSLYWALTLCFFTGRNLHLSPQPLQTPCSSYLFLLSDPFYRWRKWWQVPWKSPDSKWNVDHKVPELGSNWISVPPQGSANHSERICPRAWWSLPPPRSSSAEESSQASGWIGVTRLQ